MQEIVYVGAMVAIIAFTTLGALKLSKIKGLRSRRGVALGLLLAGSWVLGWAFAELFIPLGFIVPLFIQLLALKYLAKLPTSRAIGIGALYALITILFIGIVANIYWSQQFSIDNLRNL